MKKREDLPLNVAGLRRNLKNLTHNYSEAQVKVREATSNDAWGPSSTLMSEIADLTYNVVAFGEIMQIIWKRMNDDGRNWRHVYKALLLLEYLIRTGSEKVAEQCKENIYAIQTLKDFQYHEEGKDCGMNVREKAKHLVILLRDDERLIIERARALKAKQRLAQTTSGFGSDTVPSNTPDTSPRQSWMSREQWNSLASASAETSTTPKPELESARPQTVGEEELQLQLALAMSREEAEQEEQKRKSDDVRLQLALSQSEKEYSSAPKESTSHHLLDLLELDPVGNSSSQVSGNNAWTTSFSSPPSNITNYQKDPWSSVHTVETHHPPNNLLLMDSWSPVSNGTTFQPQIKNDPWSVPNNAMDSNDPWAIPQLQGDRDESPEGFEALSRRNRSENNIGNGNQFDLNDLMNDLPNVTNSSAAKKKTPEQFLGENSNLVNLDNLIGGPTTSTAPNKSGNNANPFGKNNFPPSLTISAMGGNSPRNISNSQLDPFAPQPQSSSQNNNLLPPWN